MNDESMQKANLFVRQNGGLARLGMSTRAMLACTGQLPWKHYRVPLSWTLFPKWFPLHFFDFVGYARGHIAPVLMAAACKSSVRAPHFPDLSTLLMEADSKEPSKRSHHVRTRNLPSVKTLSLRKLEHFLLERLEPDGGWPAFERNTNKRLLSNLAIDGAKATLTDPSSADLTGRTLEFLCNFSGYTIEDRVVQHAVHWLLRNQESNGSWYGRWGVCYIYGTWAALTGLLAAGLETSHPSIARAVKWLHDTQNADGGWGESCLSDTQKTYVALGRSTVSQTAWATDALIAAFPHPVPAIERGVSYLAKERHKSDWTQSYPTGGGLPGGFYIHFHSYNTVWTLVALGHYLGKFHPFGNDMDKSTAREE
ncbi:prenyltransferase/squalene oxidase repeat-containing protein [Alicyclobacillus fastidiosus]|uniref:Prenyltransferase/squalene oxidase repeat-containing protein n=1 Tax=Alicyclobacillus fastidiosus TaxID=392011 RepID=A0ABV5AC17_9BACL|nr:prenyltransferase/squalene oxidase repeat-containing protein [Alicyclobacillus fastidiosus]WEH10291.1 prenyltransferase/squalene oxidase repeat-containing protein [Alicyclobacillus fastidiosus]